MSAGDSCNCACHTMTPVHCMKCMPTPQYYGCTNCYALLLRAEKAEKELKEIASALRSKKHVNLRLFRIKSAIKEFEDVAS